MGAHPSGQCMKLTWDPQLLHWCFWWAPLLVVFFRFTLNALICLGHSSPRSFSDLDSCHHSRAWLLHVPVPPRGHVWRIKLELGVRASTKLNHIKPKGLLCCAHLVLYGMIWLGKISTKIMRSLEKVWMRCLGRNAPFPAECLSFAWSLCASFCLCFLVLIFGSISILPVQSIYHWWGAGYSRTIQWKKWETLSRQGPCVCSYTNRCSEFARNTTYV